MISNNPNNTEINNEIEKHLKIIGNSLNLIDNYFRNMTNKISERTIKRLTLINTIFLPLGVIVGYFGMNFTSMGLINLKKGIYTIKHGQLFVLLLCIILYLVNHIF